MRRWLLAAALLAAGAAGAYQLALRETAVAPRLHLPQPAATIGEGADAVPVAADGRVLDWLPLSEALALPRLPLSEPPERGRLGGTVLQQAQVLGAAPAELRPYLESSRHDEEQGVVVELRGGIELRFGDPSRLGRKWRAAVAVLADPSVEALDYVDLHAPWRPAVGGSGHALPPPP